jgi:hypothetical protein
MRAPVLLWLVAGLPCLYVNVVDFLLPCELLVSHVLLPVHSCVICHEHLVSHVKAPLPMISWARRPACHNISTQILGLPRRAASHKQGRKYTTGGPAYS